ncbi:hypothetical protein EES40_29040 [Streptomyces sp. ADI93-02]|nr:hypothetical protein EES40_29040 [Streptomyces sp. ADI93-02]
MVRERGGVRRRAPPTSYPSSGWMDGTRWDTLPMSVYATAAAVTSTSRPREIIASR